MERNLDSKINWVEFYKPYIKGLKKVGSDKMGGLCPFHDDSHPSFWFNTKNGCFKCEACGEMGNGQTFLEKHEGISHGEAWKRLLKAAREEDEKYTVEFYCKTKHLPMEFVGELGVADYKRGINIPYYDENGEVVSIRRRSGKKGFSWRKNDRLYLYGLQFLKDYREKGYVILVEGESDCHTLWYHGIPALGVPGASTFRGEWVEKLKGLKL